MVECCLYSETAGDDFVNLRRNWEALTFLFAGSAEPTGKPETILVEGWPSIDGSEAALIDGQVIAAFADWLDRNPDALLIGRYDSAAMVAANIYRAHVIAKEPELVRNELAGQLAVLRTFADRRRADGHGAIIVIC